MDFIDQKVNEYAEEHSKPESDLLARLNRETYTKVLAPRMLSGHLQGRILAMLAKMLQPKHILEIGTYTGYSAICLAEGLAPEGKIYTMDINEELEDIARRYFEEAGIAPQVDFRIGNALEIIPTLEVTFDLVFIDADKINYANYFDMVIDKVAKNGIIIADNVLWSGKVAKEISKQDKDTLALDHFNKKVHADERVENVLFPVRDGLMVLRKK
ncbi:MAG TPA: methyltransferase [Microscillaceae bacterium]|nr:methyltransferase [Microscillaceae bacterium]